MYVRMDRVAREPRNALDTGRPRTRCLSESMEEHARTNACELLHAMETLTGDHCHISRRKTLKQGAIGSAFVKDDEVLVKPAVFSQVSCYLAFGGLRRVH